jgi:uncharacterized membrane protein YcjF (UPF0283 family)
MGKMGGDKKMIKIGLIILAIFWVLAMFGTTDVVLWVTGFTGFVIACLGFATTLIIWRILSRLEKLERLKQQEKVLE